MKVVFVIFQMICFNSFAQLTFFLEFNTSFKKELVDIANIRDLTLDNNLSFGIKRKKVIYSLGFGREDWNLEYFNKEYNFNPAYFASHCRTYKVTVLIERQFLIPKTKLSVRLGAGSKIYFLNQMKDSYILSYPNDRLVGSKPSVLLNAIDNNVNPFNGIGLDQYSYITNVPCAMLGNIALQYNFKKCALKIYFEPYLMFVQYKNAKKISRGSNFIFYSNLGLGVNYPLNFKKKEQKVTGIE